MIKRKSFILLSLAPVLFFACLSAPDSTGQNNSGASAAEAQAAAQAALDRMDGKSPSAQQTPAQNNPAPQQSVPQTAAQGTVVNTSRSKPAWVDSVDSVYDRSQYAAAVGYGGSRDLAEKNALGNLTALFGQSIQADLTITNTYQEAVRDGVTAGWTDNTDIQNTIKTSASMDTLVGAEIKEVWQDTRANIFYAVAVMEKARAVQVYRDMILANQNVINNLVDMNQQEKNSLEGFSRYQFAAAIADINVTYGNVLSILGAPMELPRGDTYRIEAQNIIKAIPIGIKVTNDKSGRIQGAFAKAISDIGFRSGGAASRYTLDVNIVVSPVDLPNKSNLART